MTKSDELLIRSIPKALASTELICSSVNVGSTKTGINMDAVKLMGEIIKETAELTKEKDSLGCAKLVVLCNAPDDNPFMAGAFHGVSEDDAIINVGVSGPGVVKYALESVRGESFEILCETIKKTAFKITRVGQLVAQEASKRLGIPFGIIDLSLAPTPAIGDSVADILEEIGLQRAGAPGTTAALALLNDQVKKGGVMASSYVGGLSGAFIPVSEDQGMITVEGSLTIEKLEAMTCVCSVGLDMIAIPGDTKATTISGIIADEAAIGMVNQKTTAVRIIPVVGKGVGETVEFGGLLGYAPIMPVNGFDCSHCESCRKYRLRFTALKIKIILHVLPRVFYADAMTKFIFAHITEFVETNLVIYVCGVYIGRYKFTVFRCFCDNCGICFFLYFIKVFLAFFHQIQEFLYNCCVQKTVLYYGLFRG